MSKVAKRKISPRSDDADAFIRESDQTVGSRDDLAQHLAEEYLRSPSSGDETDQDSRDELFAEELGGPFIETSPEEEFGATMAGQSDPESEANPLPQAVSGLAIASADEEIEAAETKEEQGEDVDLGLEPDAEITSRLEPDIHQLERTRHLP